MGFVEQYFLQTGLGWATAGAMLAVMFGGIGSAKGIRIAASEAAGAVAEKPELFGKALVLAALPGTQGFYSFVIMFMIAIFGGMLGTVKISPILGVCYFFIGLLAGIVEWRSAINQGEVSAASINLVTKRPEESGRAILFPVLVETYAVVALLAAILLIVFLSDVIEYVPVEELVKPAAAAATGTPQ